MSLFGNSLLSLFISVVGCVFSSVVAAGLFSSSLQEMAVMPNIV